ncbi:C-type lectin 37Da-like [Cloeon dipterum]|uniref:C-type lectin 37Da-like n=1 Tax=Cloeon dipterum TaxID=197152 RepID=UPI00321F870E
MELSSPSGINYTVIYNEKLNWFDALTFCEARGLVLAHRINTEQEFDYIDGLLNGAGIRSDYTWVGGTEIGLENSYYWIESGDRVELNKWDPNQLPDTANRCLSIRNGLWFRGLCKSEYNFLCMEL